MKLNPTVALVSVVLSFVASTYGEKSLPFLSESPWLGRWIGYEEEGFDFGITSKRFQGEIHAKNRTRDGLKRVNEFQVIKIDYVVEEQVKGKWQKRSFEPKGFITSQAATTEPEQFEVVIAYKGGTKAKVTHILDGNEIKVSTEVIETSSKNPVRAGVKITFPDLYRLKGQIPGERELKKMMQGDEVIVKSTKGKKLKFDIWEEANLQTEEALADGASEFSLESKSLAKKVITMASEKAKTGKIFFNQQKALYAGLDATWFPEPAAKGQPSPALVIEID